MKVTLAQISPKLNRSNIIEIISIINEYKKESDLIIFPELALNGYLLQDKLFEDAYEINELDSLKRLSVQVDIIVGGAIRDNKVFRNAALYFSNGKLISQHNKVHLPNYGMFEEARYFSSGSVFEGFDSSHGKISMLVCEDLWHAGVHQQLFNENPDYIIAIVASPARGFDEDGLNIEDQWLALLKSASLHCNAKVIFVNRVGFEDGLGFWGGSCIVDSNAKIIHKLPHYEKIIKTFEI
ncbi:nitrilase-related carbon-nitrogen hydrolase [Sulfurimonas sp.]|uniref:nitrilase-related carbon-nitrogen hydrolase n=1 Tax=Sulfurimonas sp. TaxID=2022749 RepID=UPI002B4935B7|nr:nitrilase-related carbon-nitrogen hydrolase [Sulfurimonas sp.]